LENTGRTNFEEYHTKMDSSEKDIIEGQRSKR